MLNLEIKYGELELAAGLELQGHPEGTLVRRFHVESHDPANPEVGYAIGVGVYFRPDGKRFFLVLEDGLADRMMCYTNQAMVLLTGFMNWLSQNKAKVYPTREDFLRRPETFPNYTEKKDETVERYKKDIAKLRSAGYESEAQLLEKELERYLNKKGHPEGSNDEGTKDA